jgi:hypothetical protein
VVAAGECCVIRLSVAMSWMDDQHLVERTKQSATIDRHEIIEISQLLIKPKWLT